ncbi:NAD-dependent epimerase/dehydratase family protein [Billgrantia pellis]|uniref:NAD-dependent epimerase/dehydratase family protein n=2 Tax=Billgrantia pellis TaxID=2606936 RepID=A0A7V7G1J3_9GAMM|nr:NAD-dependent epimerase/dehydratase family protein [Halomonas pellis]
MSLQLSDYRNKNVLVTGAGGFIGSHLVEACVALGASVTALIHYNSAGSWGLLERLPSDIREGVRVVAGDIQDSDFVASIVSGQAVIFHLAALIGIPYSYVAPRSYVRTNVEGTLNVLEAARRFDVERVVHTSTSEVYGSALEVPIPETHPLQGQSPYSASKIGADKLAESYHRAFALPVVTVRPFNTFGPRQSARAFIPTVIAQALTSDRVCLGALDPQRDLTYVSDTVAGFLHAGLATGVAGEVFNLGTGDTWSIGDVARRILFLMGSDLSIVQDSDRIRPVASEVNRLVSDNRRAADALGWRPAIDLDEGLRRTIDDLRENITAYRSGCYNV